MLRDISGNSGLKMTICLHNRHPDFIPIGLMIKGRKIFVQDAMHFLPPKKNMKRNGRNRGKEREIENERRNEERRKNTGRKGKRERKDG